MSMNVFWDYTIVKEELGVLTTMDHFVVCVRLGMSTVKVKEIYYQNINECTQGSHSCGRSTNCTKESMCPMNAPCSNTFGSYQCICKVGFLGNVTDCKRMYSFALALSILTSELAETLFSP